MSKAHIVCIIDNSGSMSSASRDVIKSFNTFTSDQTAERGEALLTLVTFNSYNKIVHDRVDFKDVGELTRSDYSCGGMTAMYDAIGETLNRIKDDKVYVIIQTDGRENDSNDFNSRQVTDMINAKKSLGWEFLFMGADIDVRAAADKIGLANDAVEFNKNSKGIEVAYSTMSGNASNFRCSLDTKKLYPASYSLEQMHG